MRSGTSFFDRTVFKKTVFRFWPLWGTYFAGWLVALPLNGLMMLRLEGYEEGYMESFALYRIPRSLTDGGLMVFVVFSVLAAMAVFSHLYNPRSANLFGSLPIRREGLFLTHYLAGLSFLIVPNVVIFLLTLAVEAAGGFVAMKVLLFWLAAACGEGFFLYSLAVFCAMFTGHILALPAFYAIVNGFFAMLTMLVEAVFEMFYYGFAGFPNWVGTAVSWLTPTTQLYTVGITVYGVSYLAEPYSSTLVDSGKYAVELENAGTLAVYAAAALVLTACAFFLYRARRLESAGDVVAVSWMKPVFKYGVALCAGLALGLGTMAIIYGGETALMAAIVVWGIIGYFAAEMLLQKSFKVFGKWKGAVAVTAVFAVLFLAVGFDFTGFETRLPDAGKVDSVEVSGLGGVCWLGDSGDSHSMILTGPERIRDIILLHQAAVAQRDSEMLPGSDSTFLRITYHLKGGGTMSRSFPLYFNPGLVNQEGSAAWAIQQIYDDRELNWRLYGFDELEDYLAQGGRLDTTEYEALGNYGETSWSALFYGGDAEALFAAVKEDFFAGRIGARQVTLDTMGYTVLDGYLSFGTYKQEGSIYRHYYVRIAVSSSASSTRAALEEMADRAVVQNRTEYDPEYSGEIIMEPVGIWG